MNASLRKCAHVYNNYYNVTHSIGSPSRYSHKQVYLGRNNETEVVLSDDCAELYGHVRAALVQLYTTPYISTRHCMHIIYIYITVKTNGLF